MPSVVSLGFCSDLNQGRWSISLNITSAHHLCGSGSSVSRTEVSSAGAGGLRKGHSFQAADDRLSLGGREEQEAALLHF